MGDLIQFRPRAMPMSNPVNEKADRAFWMGAPSNAECRDALREWAIRQAGVRAVEMGVQSFCDDLTMGHADPLRLVVSMK